MTTSSTPIFPVTITTPLVQILPATVSNLVTVYTAGTNGSKVERITVTSTETANARDLQFVITQSATDYVIGTVTIPLNSGFNNSVPIVSVFDSSQFFGLATDVNGNKYLYLASGSVLKVKSLTTVASGKALAIFAQGGDF